MAENKEMHKQMFKIFSCVRYVCTYLLRLKVLEALYFETFFVFQERK